MIVRFLTPDSRMASISVSGMPHRPKPPAMITMPSFNRPASADFASGWTFFMGAPRQGDAFRDEVQLSSQRPRADQGYRGRRRGPSGQRAGRGLLHAQGVERKRRQRLGGIDQQRG